MSLITSFDPWKSKLCSCPAKYSLSAYTGCNHGCLYCYASSYIRNFYEVRPKKDFILRLEREIKKIPKNSFITMANSSDPYLPLEKKLELTKKALIILKNYDLKLMIVTRSHLILRDLDLLKGFCDEGGSTSGGKRIVISFSLTTLKENLAKKLEPNAPLPKERLEAMSELSKKLPVVCRFDPLIYPLNTDEIKTVVGELKNRGIRQIIVSTYKAKPDNFKRMIKNFPEHQGLWEKLYSAPLERYPLAGPVRNINNSILKSKISNGVSLKEGIRPARYLYLPQALRKKLIEEAKEASLKEGLEFSSCREGFNHLNTKSCDGSSFF